MVEILRKFKIYYELFGYRGLWLAVKTRLSTRPAEFSVLPPGCIHPVYLRLKTSDIATYKKIFFDLDYDLALGKTPALIVDAGANIGLASVFFAAKYPEARVLAIEPEISNFTLLSKNIAPYSNVVPIRGALWKENTAVPLVDPGMGHWGFRATDSKGDEAGRLIDKVQGMTVDKLMRSYDISYMDILKVDIEGGEKDLFENVSGWIGKVGVIMIELHDRLRVGCSRSFYTATKDFEMEACKGENIFLVRKQYLPRD